MLATFTPETPYLIREEDTGIFTFFTAKGPYLTPVPDEQVRLRSCLYPGQVVTCSNQLWSNVASSWKDSSEGLEMVVKNLIVEVLRCGRSASCDPEEGYFVAGSDSSDFFCVQFGPDTQEMQTEFESYWDAVMRFNQAFRSGTDRDILDQFRSLGPWRFVELSITPEHYQLFYQDWVDNDLVSISLDLDIVRKQLNEGYEMEPLENLEGGFFRIVL